MRSASQSTHQLAGISRAYNAASRSSRFPAECSHQANLTEPDQPFPGKTLPLSEPHRAEPTTSRRDTPAKRTSLSNASHSPAKYSYQIDLSEPDQPLPGETLSLSRPQRARPTINRRGNPASKIQQAMTTTKRRQPLTQRMLSEPDSPPTGWSLPAIRIGEMNQPLSSEILSLRRSQRAGSATDRQDTLIEKTAPSPIRH